MSMMGEPDLSAIYDYIMSLDPDEQEQALYNLQTIDQNNMYSGGGALDPMNVDLSLAYGGLMPEVNSKGVAQPPDISTINQNYTRVKNENALAVDNASAMLGGTAAYGPQAFQPTLQYGGQLLDTAQPGRTGLQRIANGTGWRSLVAQEMLSNGGDADSAIAAMMQRAMVSDEEAATLPKQDQELRATIRASLPPNFEAPKDLTALNAAGVKLTPAQQFGQEFDVKSVYDFGSRMSEAIMSDPDIPQGYTDPKTGAVYATPPEEVPSAAAKWYTDRGLPLPTDTYDSPEYMDMVSDPQAAYDSQAKQQSLNDAAGTARGQAQAAESDYDKAYKAWKPVIAAQRSQRDPLLAGLGNRGAGADTGVGSPRNTAARYGPTGPPSPQAPTSMGRYLAGNPAAAASEMNSRTDFGGMSAHPTEAQQTGQQEGALASQFQINSPFQGVDPSTLGPLGAAPQQQSQYEAPGSLKPFVLSGEPGSMDFGGADDALTSVIDQMVAGNKNPRVPDQMTPGRLAALKHVRDQARQQFVKANASRFQNSYLGATPDLASRLELLYKARGGERPLVDALRARQTVNRNQVFG